MPGTAAFASSGILTASRKAEILKELGSGFRTAPGSGGSNLFGSSGFTTAQILLFFILFLLFCFNVYIIYTRFKNLKSNSNNNQKMFNKHLDSLTLSGDERIFFSNMISKTGQVPDPNDFFENPVFFENRLSSYLESLMPLSEEEAEIIQHLVTSIRMKCSFMLPPASHIIQSTRQLGSDQIMTLRFLDKMIIASVISVNDLSIELRPDDRIFSACLPLEINSIVNIKFWRPNDAEYTGQGRLIDYITLPAAKLKISHPQKLKRVQKRRFLRKIFETPVKIYPINKKVLHEITGQIKADSQHIKPYISAISRDISGGGMGASCRHNIAKNSLVFLEFSIPDYDDLPIISARILDCIKTEHNYRLSIEFSGLMESTRESIIKFCINQ
jgi:hypothetical protein